MLWALWLGEVFFMAMGDLCHQGRVSRPTVRTCWFGPMAFAVGPVGRGNDVSVSPVLL